MKLLIIGASRGIGLELLQQALAAGHVVTALARNPQSLAVADENLKVVKGDILDKSSIEGALAGQDAVCVTIGVKVTRQPVSIFSKGTKAVVEAMKNSACRRLICVTGIGAGAYWWTIARHFASTDVAYVSGNVVQVTSLVPGGTFSSSVSARTAPRARTRTLRTARSMWAAAIA